MRCRHRNRPARLCLHVGARAAQSVHGLSDEMTGQSACICLPWWCCSGVEMGWDGMTCCCCQRTHARCSTVMPASSSSSSSSSPPSGVTALGRVTAGEGDLRGWNGVQRAEVSWSRLAWAVSGGSSRHKAATASPTRLDASPRERRDACPVLPCAALASSPRLRAPVSSRRPPPEPSRPVEHAMRCVAACPRNSHLKRPTGPLAVGSYL